MYNSIARVHSANYTLPGLDDLRILPRVYCFRLSSETTRRVYVDSPEFAKQLGLYITVPSSYANKIKKTV
jgi:hypothetical protein